MFSCLPLAIVLFLFLVPLSHRQRIAWPRKSARCCWFRCFAFHFFFSFVHVLVFSAFPSIFALVFASHADTHIHTHTQRERSCLRFISTARHRLIVLLFLLWHYFSLKRVFWQCIYTYVHSTYLNLYMEMCSMYSAWSTWNRSPQRSKRLLAGAKENAHLENRWAPDSETQIQIYRDSCPLLIL